MDCPGCNVEMAELSGDEPVIQKCGDCHGLWMDVADLNRVLLHHNMPGLETLGGKVNTDELAGQCSECQVDLVSVEGGQKQNPLHFSTCESCGGVFLESQGDGIADHASAVHSVIRFFQNFASKKKVGAIG